MDMPYLRLHNIARILVDGMRRMGGSSTAKGDGTKDDAMKDNDEKDNTN